MDDRIELFDQLLRVAALAEAEGLPLRLIGGAAMQLWGHVLNEARAMTSDLDWVLTTTELSDIETARARLEPLVPALRELGFERPAERRSSRSGRFQFQHAGGKIDVEFLCGNVPFGRCSRREPAYELVTLGDAEDPPAFYAAKTPWIDKIERWLRVHVVGTERSAMVWIPHLDSLALLKLKAVRDKLERVDSERDSERLEYERVRLQRHGDDLLTLMRWLEERGEFVDLLDRIRTDDEVRSVSNESERRLLVIDPAHVHDHASLRNGLRRLARAANSGKA
ncbi:MAG: hypothetical protein KDC14_17270 [Planctomycetes bacterium]|nr:hypothetical protein [Planctomycetota bacterium]